MHGIVQSIISMIFLGSNAVIVDVYSDGNCMWHAAAAALAVHGQEIIHQYDLRLAAIALLALNHYDLLVPLVPSLHGALDIFEKTIMAATDDKTGVTLLEKIRNLLGTDTNYGDDHAFQLLDYFVSAVMGDRSREFNGIHVLKTELHLLMADNTFTQNSVISSNPKQNSQGHVEMLQEAQQQQDSPEMQFALLNTLSHYKVCR